MAIPLKVAIVGLNNAVRKQNQESAIAYLQVGRRERPDRKTPTLMQICQRSE
jgi:hypothetical protein